MKNAAEFWHSLTHNQRAAYIQRCDIHGDALRDYTLTSFARLPIDVKVAVYESKSFKEQN